LGALPESGCHAPRRKPSDLRKRRARVDALAEDVARAKSNIHILSYIWKKGTASDRLVAAITERARSGVACRIIVDAFGSLSFEEDGVGPALRDAGCVVREFRPPALADTPKQLC
jgi:cardiolipin synthase A/B